MSRSTQGHHLNKLGSPRALDVAQQVSRSLALRFQRRRFFKVFSIYGHGSHLGHVTWTIWTNFRSPILWRLQMKFGFNRPSSFRGEDVWKCWHTTHTPTNIQTTEAYLYYKLTNEPNGSGELIRRYASLIPVLSNFCNILWGLMCILHLKDTPKFISNERSNPFVHFSFNYFVLNGGSLIFFYNLLFVNSPINTFTPTLICAMHKNIKIIFFHNLSHVV